MILRREHVSTFQLVRDASAGVLTAALSCSLACPAELLAEQPRPNSATATAHAPVPLTQQQRILHALNRLTFGPRPGDMAAVSRVGLEAWFAQQLEPNNISDANLDARLAQFPAMQLSQAELLARFPSPGELRRYTRGDVAPPKDPATKAIYADAALRQDEKKSAQEAKQSAPGQPANPTLTDSRAPGSPSAEMTEAVAPMSQSQIETLLALPPEQRLQQLLALSPNQRQQLRLALRGGAQKRLVAGLSPAQTELVAALQSPVRVVGAEAEATRLLRDAYSERQVQAVMTDFWLNHFNVYVKKNQNEPYLLPAYERETVLPHALGRFEDLLVATAQSPAMLVYLDNATSMGPNSRAAQRVGRRSGPGPASSVAKQPRGLNENYARELMELHTLGVNGGYTQQDVIEVAKCFTGWTVARPGEGGGFVFNPNWHEPGPKTVLGHTIPESGEGEGLAVLQLLASSPATARFLSLQLAQRFVSDTPPPGLVERMAAAYLHSDGNLSAVLTAMFHSPEFWAPPVYRAKVKTPLEFVTSALRASGAEVSRPLPLLAALTRLGMPIYGMQTPNGYSWQADAWVSSSALLGRMNFALVLSGNRLPGTTLQLPALVEAEPDTDTAALPAQEQRLEAVLLGEPAAAHTRAVVLAQANDPTVQRKAEQDFAALPAEGASQPPAMFTGAAGLVRTGGAGPSSAAPETPLGTITGLLVGSPEFQRR